jgi:hypothetical protein
MRSLYEDLTAEPVARSLYLGEPEVIGRLAHEASDTLGELAARRSQAVAFHMRQLADAGCLRPGLEPESALYAFAAISSGFLLIDGLGYAGLLSGTAARAELLEQSIAAAVQAPEPPADGLARVAPSIAESYRSLLVHIDNEWRSRVR